MSGARKMARRSVCGQDTRGQRERCQEPSRPSGLCRAPLQPQPAPACLLGSGFRSRPCPFPGHALRWGRGEGVVGVDFVSCGPPPRYTPSMEGAGGALEGPWLLKAPLVA